MEQLIATPLTTAEENSTDIPTSGAASTDERNKENTNTTKNEVTNTARRNLLYEECLGFIPNTLKSRQGPRYVYAKFFKQYKEFFNEDFFNILEDMGLLPQLQILQISKPNKSIDMFFRTEDAADFFVKKHMKIRGKPILFIRKAKRTVTVKGIHPEISDDALLYELEPYIEHCSSTRHNEVNHSGATFQDCTRQVFVTHLARHIPRSIKIGNRWCLLFYRCQPDQPRRPP